MQAYKAKKYKRCMDLSISVVCLIALAPLMAIIALMVKLESRGPIVFKQKRIGANYKQFDLYKFRSMQNNADKLEHHSNLNDIYDENIEIIDDQIIENKAILIGNNGKVNEQEYVEKKLKKSFRKFKNDPRVTRFGKFIRKTSLDELPQLWNVIIGDLSIVGNRPLPLYEAEMLVDDYSVRRFMAPAGLTGMWQVKRKEKKHSTAEARIRLDIAYADEYCLLCDLKILLMTPYAMIQESNT